MGTEEEVASSATVDVMMSKRTENMGISFFICAGREIGDGH
jgi:hypothetical protein